MTSDPRRPVDTDVRANDPNLSPEANRLLTEELQEAVGQERIRLPPEQARRAGTLSGSQRRGLTSVLVENRLLLLITFTALVVVGVIVSLASGTWWAVVAAAAVHAVGTLIVASGTLRLSTEVEHVEPTTAARLADEGVADPERALTDLVEQYADGDGANGAADVVSSGHNRVTASPGEAPLQSGVEQQTAMTPAGSPVEPSGDDGAPAILPVLAVAASVVIGLAAAIALGGVAWVGAAMLVGAGIGWTALVRRMDGHGEARSGRRTTRLLLTLAIVVTAVVAGVILVGAMAGYL